MMLLGSEAVVIGPGDIREAHRTGEFVPVDELERCADILRESILELLKATRSLLSINTEGPSEGCPCTALIDSQ